jgi:glycosyltransferase involved in cell wall biosynthesis|tara:strand:- start:1230 stop:2186 length:957 start_codon:yes stop_codon:yes gene_type:complete
MHISVVITCHNEEAYIEQCVNSVVTQSDYQDIKEIFVVDDGSTDNSPKLLAQLKLNCNKLKVITTKGLGLPAARNIAIKSASSEFIAFLDADDFWTKNKLLNQFQIIKKDLSIGLVYGDFWDFKKPDASDAIYVPTRSLNKFYPNQLVEYYVKDAPIVPSTTICRKKVFESSGLFDESIRTNDDTEMYLRVMEKWKVLHISGAECYKRKKVDQITHRLEKLLDDQNKISEITILRNPQLKKFSNTRKSYRILKAGIDCFTVHREKKSAFIHAINSLKLDLFNFRAWGLIIMILMPYKLTMILYNFVKKIFYKFIRKYN